ncbi:MAG: protein kinase [Pseudomonadota bacterium]
MISGDMGKYEIMGELGAGAYGRVVRARDTVLDRTVALKSLKAPKGDAQAALKREARLLAQLSHPNIVTLYELIEADDSPILVMEFVDGAPLAARLAQGALSIEDSIAIIEKLASALDFANSIGITHGDIKPSNIMLDQKGDPLLVDFGLAKFSSRESALETLSDSGVTSTSLEGTIPYMAPETVMGGMGDERADIFSLGAVFYELITGKRAFDAPSQGAVLNRVLNDPPVPIANFRPDAPRWIGVLIDTMLEKDPSFRLQSMTSVHERLVARGKRDWKTRAKSLSTRIMRYTQRKRTTPQWTSAAALAAALALSIWAINIIIIDVAPPISVQIDHGIDLVQHFERKNAVADAQDVFGRVLSDDPDHAAAQAGLALALIREYTSMETDPATLRRATAYAEAALEKDPHLALANIAAAWTAEFNSDFDRAHGLYDAADSLDKENPLMLEGRARTYKKQGNYESAINTFQKAIDAFPKEGIFYGGVGDLMARQGRYKEAEKAFRKSLELDSENVIAYANLAQAQHMQGNTRDAISTVQQGLRISPDANLYNNLGTYLFFDGQYIKAASAFERTLELDGNSHKFLYWANLADAYRWAPGKQADAIITYRRAMQLLEQEIERRPDHPGLHSRMALYAAKADEINRARDSLIKALKPPVSQPIIFYRAAVTEEIMGDRTAAITMLENAVSAGYAVNEIANDPELGLLRQDTDYQKLLIKKGKYYE